MRDINIYLQPTYFMNWNHLEVLAHARTLTRGITGEAEKAKQLFYFVRDEILYNPYSPFEEREDYQAHIILKRGEGYCIQKAIVLAALARANGIPARLRLADIQNHLIPPKLWKMMRTKIFYFHGYDELFIRNQWVKVTPTFDIQMCQRLGLVPVEFDGIHPALLNPRTQDGQLHIEYLHQWGHYADLPFEDIIKGFYRFYGNEMMRRWKEASKQNRQKFLNGEKS